MGWEDKVRVVTFLSFVSAGAILLFWAIWSCFVEVPAMTSLRIVGDQIYNFPVSISHWWDILIGFIWTPAFILLITWKKLREQEEDLTLRLVFGLVAALAAGLFVAMDIGLAPALVVVLIVVMSAGFLAGLVATLGVALAVGPAVGLIVALAAFLIIGAIISLLFLMRKTHS